MNTRQNGLSVIVNNSGHVSFNADLNFEIQEQDENASIHISDVVHSVVLEAIKGQVENARLAQGEFRLVLTGCISDVTNAAEVENVTENDEETDEEEGSDSEGSEEAEEEAEETSEEDEEDED